MHTKTLTLILISILNSQTSWANESASCFAPESKSGLKDFYESVSEITDSAGSSVSVYGNLKSESGVLRVETGRPKSQPRVFNCLSKKEGLDRGCARYVEGDKSCTKGTFGFISESCWVDDFGNGVIWDIVNLPENSEIPDAMVEKYPSEAIGRSLVFRKYRLYEQPKITDEIFMKPHYQMYADADLQIAFNYRYFDFIVKDGFLNQHQVPNTNGCACVDNRRDSENKFLNLKIDENYKHGKEHKANEIRPKYCFCAPKIEYDKYKSFYSSGYGEVIAKLHEYVKNRATFTTYDSLGAFNNETVHTYKFLSNSFPEGNYYEGSYMESQIWGALKIADVEYFLVNCYRNEGYQDLPAAQIQHIHQATGKPVYRCATAANSQHRIKGELLYAGKKAENGERDPVAAPVARIIKVTYGDEDITAAVKKDFAKNEKILNCVNHYGPKRIVNIDMTVTLEMEVTYDCVGQSGRSKERKVRLFCNPYDAYFTPRCG
ncbi:MAG: hypothetical protein JNL01_06180 [Bdellovibrionales bacterium]|nr:hypothetical protein [Bdellovibrionales bacterium]